MVSEVFIRAVREKQFRGERLYRIARNANVNPGILSQLLHNAIPVKQGDPRVVRVALLLGIDVEDAFENPTKPASRR